LTCGGNPRNLENKNKDMMDKVMALRQKNLMLRKEIKRESSEQNDVINGLQDKFKKIKKHLDTIQNYQVCWNFACTICTVLLNVEEVALLYCLSK
jgi:hypothetical protein